MINGSLLLILALFIIVGLYVARPFLLPRGRTRPLTERQALLAEKEALLARVQALDFDHETGKQDETVYKMERRLLMEEAGEILRRLDGINEGGEDIGAQIAAAVAKIRQAAGSPKSFCPKCGEKSTPEDKFCAYCGENLQ